MSNVSDQSARVAERDRWLRRSQRLRRAAAVLATVLVLGFSGLAYSANHHTSTGSSSGSSSSGGTPAPKSTSQSPTVTSGGS